jgi:hypothetical protein
MSNKIGNFEIWKEMAKRNLKIQLSPSENITNASYSKKTRGTTISIGVDGNICTQIALGQFVGGLLLCDREQYFAIKKELEDAISDKD